MKRLFALLLFAVLCLNGVCFGQMFSGWGVKAGMNLANQEWIFVGTDRLDPRAGVSVGVFGEFFDRRWFSVVGELSFNQKGSEETIEITSETSPVPIGSYKLKNEASYLGFSISAKLKKRWENWVPYVFGGPRFDILLDNHTETFGFPDDKFKATAFGVGGGFGLEYSGFPLGLLLEAAYSEDLTNSSDYGILEVRNNLLQIRLGARF